MNEALTSDYCETVVATEPNEGAIHDPALRKTLKPLTDSLTMSMIHPLVLASAYSSSGTLSLRLQQGDDGGRIGAAQCLFCLGRDPAAAGPAVFGGRRSRGAALHEFRKTDRRNADQSQCRYRRYCDNVSVSLESHTLAGMSVDLPTW